MSSYTWGWFVWIGMFFAIEGKALLRRDWDGTLTNHIRRWASLDGKASGWLWRRGALGALTVWLVLHFWA